jgi:hypothetical protein
VHLLPLHGVPVALTCSPAPGVVVASDFAASFREKLNGHGVDWSLVILDPLSRWAGGGIESNNEAATRFCQVIETLSTVYGNPSVLVAHHSSQATARAGQSDARGVTAIRDGFRWQASMDAVTDDDAGIEGVLFRNLKSNYSLRFRPLVLVRNTDPGIEGTLRPANRDETDALRAVLPADRQSPSDRDQAKQNRKREAFEADCERILEILPPAPKHMSTSALDTELRAAGTPKSDKTLKGLLDYLASEKGGKRITDLSDGKQASARMWARGGT